MPTDTSDAQIDSALSALRAVLIAIGGWMASNGMGQSGAYRIVELAASAVMIVGPAVWGAYVAIMRVIQKKKAVTQAVQAGINLTVSGAALAADGKSVVSLNNGATPPLPVTDQTAAQIVKDFAPAKAT
jgi:hypothetical protein